MSETILSNITDAARFYTAELSKLKNIQNFKAICVKITQIKDKVTRQQQSIIFGVLYPALQKRLIECGYDEFVDIDDEEMHNAMKTLFFFKEIRTKQGMQKIPKTLKLGKANREAVINYINDLLDFGAKIGVAINQPQDEWYTNLD